MRYIAIIGDMVNSRELGDRYAIQEKLNQVLGQINERYGECIKSRFVITLGDEFQGLIELKGNPVEIIKEIQNLMYPVMIRFGIGIGEITTKILPEAALGADGPAYYGARAIIDELKVREKKEKNKTPDIQICLYGEESFSVRQINMFFCMMKMLENSWSWVQRTTIWDMHKIGGSQAQCAERMGVSQPTVQRRLETGNYNTYFELLDITEESIGRLVMKNV